MGYIGVVSHFLNHLLTSWDVPNKYPLDYISYIRWIWVVQGCEGYHPKGTYFLFELPILSESNNINLW